MTTELAEKFSARVVNGVYRIGNEYYRAVESPTLYDKFYLFDIRNGGTIYKDVPMSTIENFIGEEYELVSVVETYEKATSIHAKYILPQTVDTWFDTWNETLQEQFNKCVNGIYEVNEGAEVMRQLLHVNSKIDMIFNEFQSVRNKLFQENLAETSYNEIVKILTDYSHGEHNNFFNHFAIKKISDTEFFVIYVNDYDDDETEYFHDSRYGKYLEVRYMVYSPEEDDIEFSLNLAQRHHHFYFMWS